MADTKISALTATTTVGDTDEYVVAVSGASKKITGANLKAGVQQDYKPGGTDVAVADGGTGASTAGAARTALGLAIGTDVPAQATFDDHSARHEDGGADEISIAGLSGTSAELTNHLGDTVDAHDASAISFSPVGTIAATDVQAAIAEVASEAGTGSVASDAIWDTKGDLAVATGANTASKLAVGTNTHVLTADSGEATGVKWAAPAGGGGALTLIATVTRGSDGAIDFTGIAGSYNSLYLFGLVRSARSASISNVGVQFNADTGTNYGYQYVMGTGTTVSTVNNVSGEAYTGYALAAAATAAANRFSVYKLEIPIYAGSTHKTCSGQWSTMDTTSYVGTSGGVWANTAAITRITFWDASASNGTFATGSVVHLYGRT